MSKFTLVASIAAMVISIASMMFTATVYTSWTPWSVTVDAKEYVTTFDGERVHTGYTFGWMQEVVRMPMKEYLDSLNYISMASLLQTESEFESCTSYTSFGVSMVGFSFSHSSGETDMRCITHGNVVQ